MAEFPEHQATELKHSDQEKVAALGPSTSIEDGQSRQIFKHADPNDGDEALKAFAGQGTESIVMTPEMDKKLLRKIDMHLMPVSGGRNSKNQR